MNSWERFRKRLKGETVDRPPNFDIMMTFACHYINEPLCRYYQDYRVLCEANLAVLEAFDLDIVQAISDPYREAADFGAKIEFPENGLPICKEPLIRQESDLKRLVPVNPASGKRMNDRLEAVSLFRQHVGGQVPVMGWVEGAMAEAADLRGVSTVLMDIFERPEWLKELLEICVETGINFARAQIDAGADIIGLGDSVVSQVSPQQYEEFALPYQQRIFSAVKEMGAVPRLHICGNTSLILNQMAQSGAEIIDLDWMVDFGSAARLYGDYPVICGNFDPVKVLLQGTPALVKMETLKCLQTGGPRCINMAGCEVPFETPYDNLLAQTKAIKEFGSGLS
ncbi:uroporphyrinogen decarboxylase family protein [candidate division KSB1 bacterium]|nr:uroporphyrinogen decarboxylase family protein [candidate division KSB1 bacterium]